MYAFIAAACILDVTSLDAACQIYALFHVLVLHEFKDDVAFGLIGVEVRVTLLVILFIENYGVLTFGYIQIGLSTCHTEGVGFGTIGNAACRK